MITEFQLEEKSIKQAFTLPSSIHNICADDFRGKNSCHVKNFRLSAKNLGNLHILVNNMYILVEKLPYSWLACIMINRF